MLRVLVFDEPLTLVLRVEGVLDVASVGEFHRAVASAKAQRGDRQLVADVGNMRLQDADAESALIKERNAGLRLFAATGRVAEVLERQDRRACESKCGKIRRIAFELTTHCNKSSRPLCRNLYRLLHAAHLESAD